MLRHVFAELSQHRRGNSSGQDREDGWFERGVKEAIYVKVEQPSLNRGGGLRHHLSPAYNAVLKTVPLHFVDQPTCSTVETVN